MHLLARRMVRGSIQATTSLVSLAGRRAMMDGRCISVWPLFCLLPAFPTLSSSRSFRFLSDVVFTKQQFPQFPALIRRRIAAQRSFEQSDCASDPSSEVLFPGCPTSILASVSECGTPKPWKEGLSSEGFDRNLSSSEGLDPTSPISPPGGGPPQPTPRSHLDYVCRELYCRVRLCRSLSVLFQSGITLAVYGCGRCRPQA